MSKILKDRYSISADELEARMQAQQKYHDEPISKAVAVLSEARDMIMRELGIDTEKDVETIQTQQDLLGIILTEETREEMAGLNGWFIFLRRKGDIIPFCWIGAAQLNNAGEVTCEIHRFQDNRLKKITGPKLVGS